MNSAEAKTLSREVLDFAPGLLAIQESPPPRLPRVIMLIVVVLFVILLAWATFGRLDIVASAEGRLVPKTYVKIVQPAESGIVQDILVSEGDEVEAGQVLMRMDAKLTEADVRTIRNEFELKRLQLIRIDAELTDQPMKAEDENSRLFAQVQQQYKAHRKAYLDAIAQEKAILEKTRHELRAAEELLSKLRKVVPTYRKSAEAFKRLSKDGYVSALAVEEKQREYIESAQDLRAQEETVASLKSVIAATQRKLSQISSNYRSELQNERIETEAQYSRLREELDKIEHKAGMLALRAPQKGIIKDLATHTRGTVVSPGTVLMSLVPYDEPLRAEVFIDNKDVGFVNEGQRVKIKLAAYPFQKYGMIDGTVLHVDPDAADLGGKAGESPMSSLRYKALVSLDTQQLKLDDTMLRLTPGMQVVADIHLGSRTVMEYLLSPVQKAWYEAGRER
jgi:HlyD family secretion protein